MGSLLLAAIYLIDHGRNGSIYVLQEEERRMIDAYWTGL